MNEKKKKNNWELASYQFVALVAPLFLIIDLFTKLIDLQPSHVILILSIFSIVAPIITWISVILSSRWIVKKYAIYNYQAVVKLATVYLLAPITFFLSKDVFKIITGLEDFSVVSALYYTSTLAIIGVFYFSNRYYLGYFINKEK